MVGACVGKMQVFISIFLRILLVAASAPPHFTPGHIMAIVEWHVDLLLLLTLLALALILVLTLYQTLTVTVTLLTLTLTLTHILIILTMTIR